MITTAPEQVRPAARERAAEPPPRLAEGIELLGEYEGSGFKEAPYLARRVDGQVLSLPQLLYLVAEQLDGRRDEEEIAGRVAAELGRPVSAANVRYLIEKKLRPLGVAAAVDGSTPKLERLDPLLGISLRAKLVPERAVQVIAAVFAPLFHLPVVGAALAGLVALDVWLFFVHGVAQPTRALIYQPVLLLMVYAFLVAAALFHETGHAAAARFGGARPGKIGAGLYLIWPVFYTDVTDAYRLGRGGRLRTDLGGIYFNVLFALGTAGAYFATGFEPLLVIVLLQHVQILYQFIPFLRLDGFYIISDLTGVPDMFARIKPTLRSLLPGRKPDERVEELKPWARAVVTAYVLLLVPVIAAVAALVVVNAPRIFATAWDSLFLHYGNVSSSFGDGRELNGMAGVAQIASLVLPAIGLALGGTRIGKRTLLGAWRWSEGSPVRRALVTTATGGVVAALVFAWWPNGQYKPIQPEERGTLAGAVEQLSYVPSGRAGLTAEREAELGGAGFVNERSGGAGDWRIVERTGEENVAAALNRRDGTSIFALAFSIVYLTGNAVDQSNTAVAYASCERCRAIAVAIQIVLVLADPNVIAPENEAVAVTHSCTLCISFAWASQLIFGDGRPLVLTPEGEAQIEAIRGELAELGAADLSVAELEASLREIVARLQEVLANELVPAEEGSTGTDDEDEPTETTSTTETETGTTETTTTESTTTTGTTTGTTTTTP